MQRYGLDDSMAGSPRTVFRLGSQHGIRKNVQFWVSMLDGRNQAVHLYDEQQAHDLMAIIKERYIQAFGDFESIPEEMMRDVSSDTQIHECRGSNQIQFLPGFGCRQTMGSVNIASLRALLRLLSDVPTLLEQNHKFLKL